MTALPNDDQILNKINAALGYGLYIFDLKKQTIVWANDRALKRFDYSWDDIQKMGDRYLKTVVHPDDLASVETFLAKVNTLPENSVLLSEYRFKDKHGQFHWRQDRVAVFAKDRDGTVIQIAGSSTDADTNADEKTALEKQASETKLETEHEIAEAKAKLISSAKMAALGEMSGGIAHEINNPLTVIQARAFQLGQMVESQRLDPEKVKLAAESISRTADKITRIIKSLRSFAREGSQDPFELVPVQQIIQETLEFCKTRFYNYGVEIEMEPIDPDLEVECRLIQIEQVLLNLLNNSFDAIQNLDKKWIQVSALDLGSEVQITVTDSGSGIPEALLEKIMRPFFTTKDLGKGTGLGLSISNGIIKSHKGALTVNRQSANTCFAIRLPKFQQDRD